MVQELTVLGIMSGTSLDGLDLCCVKFKFEANHFNYQIIASETHSYSSTLLSNLKRAFHMPKVELNDFNKSYGQYIGKTANAFLERYHLKEQIDLIGSHGHTIFHEPHKQYTLQIGDGQAIANETGIDVINDFRSGDVLLGGQGAPLVPIGDKLLFHAYESCLNLGGFANISYDVGDTRIAFDLCPANLPLNSIMEEHFTSSFDKDGLKARAGTPIEFLRTELNDLAFYQMKPPKSLGVEWLNEHFYPCIRQFTDESAINILRTIVEHETDIIADVLTENSLSSCLVTGGGAYNRFFIELLKSKTETEIIIPSNELVEYKEALIFAFLAFLNMNNQINILKSVTGAERDSIGGVHYSPQ